MGYLYFLRRHFILLQQYGHSVQDVNLKNVFIFCVEHLSKFQWLSLLQGMLNAICN